MRQSWSSGITSFQCLWCGMMYHKEIWNKFECVITFPWSLVTQQQCVLLNIILMKLMCYLIIMIGPLTTGMVQYVNTRIDWSCSSREIPYVSVFVYSIYLLFGMRNVVIVWLFLCDLGSSSSPLQLQQATSNHSKTCPEGTEKENESSEYRQWPLRTPNMINVKGFLFLICQSF